MTAFAIPSHFSKKDIWIRLCLATGTIILAYEPLLWLVQSWADPSYDSKGFYVFALCVALLAWSVLSPSQNKIQAPPTYAYGLLIFTSFVRLISQVLAINVIGAIALTIDVYAVGVLLRLKQRQRAISPFWLAALFSLSLPLERILQRTIGYGLQHLSAAGSCQILTHAFPGTVCQGIRIIMNNKDVLIDLPCSGARSLILLCIFFASLMVLRRPTWRPAILLGFTTVLSALIGNIIRICMLSIGIAYPEWIKGIDVMAQPWHDIIGLVCLVLASAPLLLLTPASAEPIAVEKSSKPPLCAHKKMLVPAIGFLVLAVVIISLPRRPLDVARTSKEIVFPENINDIKGTSVALTKQEEVYFTQYGGTAKKMRYGTRSLMLVQTSSPLRHLHSPDECLRGMGFSVHYAGLKYTPIPTAFYIATAPDKSQWRIAVSFYSDDGHYTTNVSEAVWNWMQNRNQVWYALQRITPLSEPDQSFQNWDQTVLKKFDLPNSTLPKQGDIS